MPRFAHLSLLPAVVALTLPAFPQDLGDLSASPRPHSRELVSYVPEAQEIPAGRESTLEIHLQIAPGIHINSHTPSSDLLLPTILTLTQEPGIKVSTPVYPHGAPYRFAGSADTLDVYTGTLALRLPVQATPGSHVLHATFRYQACDSASCFPPKQLPVDIPFTAHS